MHFWTALLSLMSVGRRHHMKVVLTEAVGPSEQMERIGIRNDSAVHRRRRRNLFRVSLNVTRVDSQGGKGIPIPTGYSDHSTSQLRFILNSLAWPLRTCLNDGVKIVCRCGSHVKDTLIEVWSFVCSRCCIEDIANLVRQSPGLR